jgi:hypothetical protein
MKNARVINISKAELLKQGYRDLEHWLENPDHIYIGRTVRYVSGARQSKWANPFSRKKYGRKKCIDLYDVYIRDKAELLDQIEELNGKVLGCWCKPDRCHGDVLISLLKDLVEEE